MKKILVTAMAVLTMAMAVGCSANAVPKASEAAQSEAPATQSAEQPAEEAATPATQETAAGEALPEGAEPQQIQGDSVFGKVKSIVGNEIELEVAKPPFGDMGAESGAAEGAAAAGAGGVTTQTFTMEAPEGVGEDSSGEASESTGGIAYVDENGNVTEFGGPNGKKMELEYTGETMNITVPAGVEILSLLGGEGKLDSIKKGSVLMLMVKDAKENPATASNITIME